MPLFADATAEAKPAPVLNAAGGKPLDIGVDELDCLNLPKTLLVVAAATREPPELILRVCFDCETVQDALRAQTWATFHIFLDN